MNEYEQKLKDFIANNHVQAEHLTFSTTCHSVEEAAASAHASLEDFVKNICMVKNDGSIIVAIVKGEDKVDRDKVALVLNIDNPKMGDLEALLLKTGYPAGGIPSFGYDATFLIDPRVMKKEFIYSGGGSDKSLVKISPKNLQEANGGVIVDIRK